LYESLHLGVSGIRLYQTRSSLIIPGPIWLFQLWLLATFKEQLKVTTPTDLQNAYDNKSTEGLVLAKLRRKNWGSQDLFRIAYEALLGCDTFTPLLAPFSNRTCGPNWFTIKFLENKVEEEEETNAILQAYLTPTFLSSRVRSSDSQGVYGYQPNLVARQFGLVQPKPCSLYKCLSDLQRPMSGLT